MNTAKNKLYIFSGLPGTGKTSLARRLARATRACYLRIDTIEQGLRDLCQFKVEGEGYRLSYRIAHDNLLNGINVIADSCNPIKLTRTEWNQVAYAAAAEPINIEVICSDTVEHKARVESRISDIDHFKLPTWNDVIHRQYHQWQENKDITIDTAFLSIEECFTELSKKLQLKNTC